MRRALVSAFAAVITYEQAKFVSKILVQLTDITDDEKSTIWKAYEANGQIRDSYGVREALVRAIGNQPIKKVAPIEDDVPF